MEVTEDRDFLRRDYDFELIGVSLFQFSISSILIETVEPSACAKEIEGTHKIANLYCQASYPKISLKFK